MNTLQLSVRHTVASDLLISGHILHYYLIPFPTKSGTAWSLAAIDEDEGSAMSTNLIFDLTSDEETAERCLQLCTEGYVLPEDLEEIVMEILAEDERTSMG